MTCEIVSYTGFGGKNNMNVLLQVQPPRFGYETAVSLNPSWCYMFAYDCEYNASNP